MSSDAFSSSSTQGGRMSRRMALAGLGALGLSGPAVRAAPGGLPSNVGHADSSPQWEELRAKLWGREPIVAGEASKVQLIVPLRAAFGASVPVKVLSKLPQTEALHVKRMTLLVDKNPAPIAAVLDMSPRMGQADLETRLRVDEYGHVRVVSELSDGSLHMDSRYCKVSGGCSAPPNRDQLHNIGKTVFRLPEGLKTDGPTPAEVSVVHPNDTGFELNHITVMYIPPHYVRLIKVSYDGEALFNAEVGFSLSENPSLRFNLLARPGGRLNAEVEDTKEGRFRGQLALA